MKKDTHLKILFIILSLITVQNSLIACSSCIDGLFFCNTVNEDLYILKAVVNSNPRLGFVETMEITILDNIHQEASQDTIIITGGNSMMTCGQSLKVFSPQDTLILALRHNPKTRKDYWFLSTGKHFLTYKNGMVIGKISHSLTTQTIQEFKDNLFNCIGEIPIYEFKNEQNISMFPNTSTKGLGITTEQCLITGYYLYDFNLKEMTFKVFDPAVRNLEVNLKALGKELNYSEKGPNFLRITTDKGEIVWQFAWTNH